MRSTTIFLVLTAASAGIAATLAGCGTGPSGRPSATSTLAATRQAGRQLRSQPARSAQAPPARTTARNGSAPARSSPTATPPASHGPAPRRNVVTLTRGLYTDAPDGKPHYVLAFTSTGGGAVRGSVSYLYQDGRISAVGKYAGKLSAGGRISLRLGDGKILSGRYASGRLTLAGCTAVLPLATPADGCTFSYHGHVP